MLKFLPIIENAFRNFFFRRSNGQIVQLRYIYLQPCMLKHAHVVASDVVMEAYLKNFDNLIQFLTQNFVYSSSSTETNLTGNILATLILEKYCTFSTSTSK